MCCASTGEKVNYMKPRVDSSLMDSFIRDARKTVALLEELNKKTGWWENEEELLSYIISIHGIKSSLGSIGEAELSKTAFKLETSGRDENFDIIKSTTPGFLDGLSELLKKLEQEFNDGAEISEKDSGDIYEVLSAIKKMCGDYNRKGVLDLISSVKNCTRETKDALENVKEYVLHSDFDEAEAAAASYIDMIK